MTLKRIVEESDVAKSQEAMVDMHKLIISQDLIEE
jgi:hypothetical protein